MVNLTRRITAEDLSLRLTQAQSRDEIGELADTLNDMISRLESSFERIKQFSADAAHEIKTPLTQIECNAEVALRRKRPEAEYRQVIKAILDDAHALETVVNDLLFLATTDSQNLSDSFKMIPLNEVFFEAFEEAHQHAREKNLSIIFQEIEPVEVRGNRRMLKQLLKNLIVNAIQYTPNSGSIEFSLSSNDKHAEWRIIDTGIGIDEHSLQRIFDRFYRADPSRSHETGGSGLGLAIAKRIVEIHSGSISVHSKPAEGTMFTVLLPQSIENKQIRGF
jgi:signal transduction histidine kinase